ncbi:MAG: ferritin family protein [Sedimentisphaerales bacterium]|nr:ferritin family protein [Sedimentisphaerales bacterium]
MAISFNADEIFEMAEEIERKGAKFYHKAAQKAPDSDTKDFFNSMAGMEENHLKIFKEMRKELSDAEKGQTVYDPEDEAILYLKAMADAKGWEGMITPTKEFTGNESMKEIIEIALNSEKESVVFYYGLKSMVPAQAGRDKVEKIIKEELGHIRILLGYLEKAS